ncbi:MAG: hypothetical protein HZB65_01080 [Candidatus Aenigmarchaeota archaeon]|nr:hypothetical protein [Candidatus Aenigmarchaeota archaeon]
MDSLLESNYNCKPARTMLEANSRGYHLHRIGGKGEDMRHATTSVSDLKQMKKFMDDYSIQVDEFTGGMLSRLYCGLMFGNYKRK